MSKLVDDSKKILKDKGYKLTKQRKQILDVFANNTDMHLSPEEVYDNVKINYPDIGLATVYRTIMLFEDIGILYRVNFDDGCNRYEMRLEEDSHTHHHLVCLNCGKIEEVNIDLLDDLEKKIEKNKSFEIKDHSVKFFGYCKDCKDKF